jgi:hypothetical protein
MRRSEKMSNAEISRDEAIEIATRSRNQYRADLPERCTRATGASDEPPEGMYRLEGTSLHGTSSSRRDRRDWSRVTWSWCRSERVA